MARRHEPWRAALRLGCLALLRSAYRLVEDDGTDTNADPANANSAATAAAMMPTAIVAAAHLAGQRRAWARGTYQQEQRQGRSN